MKKTKRIIGLFLAVLLLFTSIPYTEAKADTGTNGSWVSIWNNNKYVVLDVWVYNSVGICAYQSCVEYDNTMLTYEKYEKGAIGNSMISVNKNLQNGRIDIGIINTEDFFPDGLMVRLYFSVNSGADGVTDIKYTESVFEALDGTQYELIDTLTGIDTSFAKMKVLTSSSVYEVYGEDNFYMNIDVDNNKGFSAYQSTLTYDTSLVKYKGYKLNSSIDAICNVNDNGEGQLEIGIVSNENISTSNILSLEFEAKPESSGSACFSNQVKKISNTNLEEYIVDNYSTSVQIMYSKASNVMTITVPDTIKENEIIDTYINICNNKGFRAADLKVSYDTNYLDYLSVDKESVLDNTVFSANNKDGIISMGAISNDEITTDGKLVKISFLVKDKEATNTKLKLNVSSLVDAQLNELKSNPSDTSFTIISNNIVASEHTASSEWEVILEPTCHSTGIRIKRCTDEGCVAILEVETIAKKAHTIVIDKGVEATCTQAGLSEGKHCSVCGEIILEQQEIPATGHTKDNEWTVVTDSTCKNTGVKVKKCTTCGEILESMVIEKTDHTVVVDEAKAATCNETGLTEGSHCSECGEIIVEQQIISKLTEHNQDDIGDWEIVADSTCSKEGKKVKKCTKCGEIVEETVIAKKAHTIVTDKAVAATCTKTGLTQGCHCSVCKAVITAQNKTAATKNISKCAVSGISSSYKYTGKAIKPSITLKDETTKISSNYYTVSYKYNTNVGTATVTITSRNGYSGKITKTFKIVKTQAKLNIKTTKYTKTYGNKAISLGASTAGTAKLSYSSSNKNVATVDSKGKVTFKGCGICLITVKAYGSNYLTTTKKVTITVKPKSVSSLTVKSKYSKKLSISWKRDKTVTGYEIQYSTSKSFASRYTKSVKVTKNSIVSKTIGGLTGNKTYYVRVREYKKSGSSTLYSTWSSARKIKIKR